MTRSQRILRLIDLLASAKDGMTAKKLAEVLKVSERTVFRDIQTLRLENMDVELYPNGGFYLNVNNSSFPILLKRNEIEALALGANWVIAHGDPELASHAKQALGKLKAKLPFDKKDYLTKNPLLIPPPQKMTKFAYFSELKNAIHDEMKVKISYLDLKENSSVRVIWPFAIAYYENVILLIAWCEDRKQFRHFRCDRIQVFNTLQIKYPNNRIGLYQLWLEYQINHAHHDKN